MPRQPYPRYPLDRWLGGPENRSRRRGEEKILPLPGLELRHLVHPIASHYTDCAIPARCTMYVSLNLMWSFQHKRITNFHTGRSMCLPITVAALNHWDRGFESHMRHGCLCAFILCFCAVLCVQVAALRRADPPSKKFRSRNWKSGQGPKKGCRAIDRYEWMHKGWAIPALALRPLMMYCAFALDR
jgi:hypothetical protein